MKHKFPDVSIDRCSQSGDLHPLDRWLMLKLTIITKGNVGACRFLLQEEGLLGFFEKIFGMLGQFYGESDFDQANKQPSELEGTTDCQLPDAKAKLIQALMSQEGLGTGEAVLVEDDPAEIASVKDICQSV